MNRSYNSRYEWNPVFRFVMDIKYVYIEKFKMHLDMYEPHGNLTFFEYWIDRLDIQEYRDKIKFLQINANDKFLLIRYANYTDVLSGEEEMTLDELWNMDDGFYLECRSIVIDVQKEAIVLCPFKKFRNIGECEENSIENIRDEIAHAKNIEISNKLDGSMQSAGWYEGRMIVAGSQAIDPTDSWRLTDGIRMLEENPNYIMAIRQNPSLTFIFEYISMRDAHVVKYKPEEEGMYLVGLRNVFDGKQMSYSFVLDMAKRFGLKSTNVFDKTFDEVLADMKTIKSDEQEGFVLNIDGHLVKCKGDDYVSLHKSLSKISSINLIIKNYADGTLDDLRAKIPTAYKERIDAVVRIISKYVKEINKDVYEYYFQSPKCDKKTFMIWTEKNVPKHLRCYVRNKFLGIENNYIKSGSGKTPHYKKLCDMGVKPEDYKLIFVEDL